MNNNNGSRAPFGDKTNTIKGAEAKERKREGDRALRQAMTQDKRDEFNRKRREAYHRRKEQQLLNRKPNVVDDASNKENIDPDETSDWLHRNDSLLAHNMDDEPMAQDKREDHQLQMDSCHISQTEPVFSHGQLSVALSRATTRSNIRVLAVPAKAKDLNKTMPAAVNGGKKRKKPVPTAAKGVDKRKKPAESIFTRNIVYKEVLTL